MSITPPAASDAPIVAVPAPALAPDVVAAIAAFTEETLSRERAELDRQREELARAEDALDAARSAFELEMRLERAALDHEWSTLVAEARTKGSGTIRREAHESEREFRARLRTRSRYER